MGFIGDIMNKKKEYDDKKRLMLQQKIVSREQELAEIRKEKTDLAKASLLRKELETEKKNLKALRREESTTHQIISKVSSGMKDVGKNYKGFGHFAGEKKKKPGALEWKL